MRICEVSPYGLTDVSGVASVVLELARGFAGRGNHVTVAAPGPVPRDLPPGVASQQFEAQGPFRNVSVSLQVARWLWRHRTDWEILHVHQGHLITLTAATMFRMFGRPVVTTFHLLPPEPKGIRRFIQRWTVRNTARISTARVYVSEHTKGELQGDGIVIRNGVDLPRIRSLLGSRDTLRRELGLNGCVVLFSGRIAFVKGYPDLLRAIRMVRDMGCDVSLLVTGLTPADERERMARLVR
ncbi:MAG TPA: glycosyltransferase family 4 protein, partial [Thermoplasmata archaeon]|nr:glycosyltransferase family 4 protein [Thermoplasmata archaeon]